MRSTSTILLCALAAWLTGCTPSVDRASGSLQNRSAASSPGTVKATPKSANALGDFRKDLTDTLDRLEGRWALFCFAATDNGEMPSASQIASAVSNTAELQQLAQDLAAVAPPPGGLAVANDAKDISSSVTSAITAAVVVGGQLKLGAVEVEVARPVYAEEVIEPCDEVYQQIRTLREEVDVLQ